QEGCGAGQAGRVLSAARRQRQRQAAGRRRDQCGRLVRADRGDAADRLPAGAPGCGPGAPDDPLARTRVAPQSKDGWPIAHMADMLARLLLYSMHMEIEIAADTTDHREV